MASVSSNRNIKHLHIAFIRTVLCGLSMKYAHTDVFLFIYIYTASMLLDIVDGYVSRYFNECKIKSTKYIIMTCSNSYWCCIRPIVGPHDLELCLLPQHQALPAAFRRYLRCQCIVHTSDHWVIKWSITSPWLPCPFNSCHLSLLPHYGHRHLRPLDSQLCVSKQ